MGITHEFSKIQNFWNITGLSFFYGRSIFGENHIFFSFGQLRLRPTTR